MTAMATTRIPDVPSFEQLHAQRDALTLSPLNMDESARFTLVPAPASPDPPAPASVPAPSPPPAPRPLTPDESPFEDDDDEEDCDQTTSGDLTPTGPRVAFRSPDHPPLAPSEFPLHSDLGPTNAILVDEGDVVPQEANVMAEMDVAFDDEGLSTLERIFLLSRSDYAFHRAYVARVLGDLLGDVDPCESVEYVLPLISGFSLDDDDTVKEAFAADLHRILWYFFTVSPPCTCAQTNSDRRASLRRVKTLSATRTTTRRRRSARRRFTCVRRGTRTSGRSASLVLRTSGRPAAGATLRVRGLAALSLIATASTRTR